MAYIPPHLSALYPHLGINCEQPKVCLTCSPYSTGDGTKLVGVEGGGREINVVPK